MSLAQQIRAWGQSHSPATLRTDIDDEMEFHIQSRMDELLRSGLSQESAATQANREFGDRHRLGATCQRIQLASQIWTTRLVGTGLLAAIVAIGWLGWSLYTLKSENLNLASRLQTAVAMAASPVTAVRAANDDLGGTVLDTGGNPVANARVLLVHKSWPGGHYRQNVFETTTDANGRYEFRDQYSQDMQNAFLVSILGDGHELQSKYEVFDRGKTARGFDFRLKPAEPVTLQFVGSSGPLSGIPVFVASRMADGQEHSIYYQSSDSATWPADESGNVSLAFFRPGDQVSFALHIDGQWKEVRVKIGDQPHQQVQLNGNSGDHVTGSVVDSSGEPVANARVLLVHKSWPNNRYQQKVLDTVTDDRGVWRFTDQYSPEEKNAFLVTILADGLEMQSIYEIVAPGADAPSFDFQLQSATPILMQFVNEAGEPLADAPVFITSRQSGEQKHLAYLQSSEAATWNTDNDGYLALGYFSPGDQAGFAVQQDGQWNEVSAVIGDENATTDGRQTVVVKKKVMR